MAKKKKRGRPAARRRKASRKIGARTRKSASRAPARKAARRSRRAKSARTSRTAKAVQKGAERAATSRRSSARPRARVDQGWRRGLGPESAGQSGDTERISRAEIADSESVEELLEEGQAFEAGVVGGVESAPDASQGAVRTRQVPEDDVPQEYLDED